MPTIQVLQHLFSNMPKGYFPEIGRGFQTVAVSKALLGTEDLKTLERASHYELRPERRAAGDFPVKETFFGLPSGRFVIGKTVSAGVDSLGREGNYLTHHLIIERKDFREAGCNPFVFLDTVPLADPGTDLTPRLLPPILVTVEQVPPDFRGLSDEDRELLARLVIAARSRMKEPLLLIGEEARTRRLLRALFSIVPQCIRSHWSFSTHHDASEALYSIACVRSWKEAPSKQVYTFRFDLESGEYPDIQSDPYTDWLSGCIRRNQEADRQEIAAVMQLVDALLEARSAVESSEVDRDSYPATELAILLPLLNAANCNAIWLIAEEKITPVLVGRPAEMELFLQYLSSPGSLAESLLFSASPYQLLGKELETEEAVRCLHLLRNAVAPKVWRFWTKEWEEEKLPKEFQATETAWWRFWPSKKGK